MMLDAVFCRTMLIVFAVVHYVKRVTVASTSSAKKQEVSSEICNSMDALKLRHLAWQESVEVGICIMMFQTETHPFSILFHRLFVFKSNQLKKDVLYMVYE